MKELTSPSASEVHSPAIQSKSTRPRNDSSTSSLNWQLVRLKHVKEEGPLICARISRRSIKDSIANRLNICGGPYRRSRHRKDQPHPHIHIGFSHKTNELVRSLVAFRTSELKLKASTTYRDSVCNYRARNRIVRSYPPKLEKSEHGIG